MLVVLLLTKLFTTSWTTSFFVFEPLVAGHLGHGPFVFLEVLLDFLLIFN